LKKDSVNVGEMFKFVMADTTQDPGHSIRAALNRSVSALVAQQHPDGYWCFELEADCTIPAEYVLLMHYTGEVDRTLAEKIAVYLRERQQPEGGWPLYHGGAMDLSCSVKVYYALKLAGDDPAAAHMQRARDAILGRGGAARANVFTRITLALFQQVPWRATPFIPVEAMLLPRWFPFHLSKVAYWSRTVMVPLFVLCSLKPIARNPDGLGIAELFTTPPDEERDYFPVRSGLNRVFLMMDSIGKRLERLIPRWLRERALRRAETWFVERLNAQHGLGAIFPAMVNAYEALQLLGYPADHEYCRTARQSIDDLLVVSEKSAYCQPCLPPVWDTALAALALLEAGPVGEDSAKRGLAWLDAKQLSNEPGDWRESRPHLAGGGWPFQFENAHYPDLDDTGAVVWAMKSAGRSPDEEHLSRAVNWICGMQSRNGGFGAFDVDNTHYRLNEIPFADHGALLDPPTADVSARCAIALWLRGESARAQFDACVDYLRREQEASGAWFGRWGTNYIYGTWSVLSAFEQIGIPGNDPAVRRAVAWLQRVQRADGGWGEHNDSYEDPASAGQASQSTAFQTAWAMIALMSAGEGHCEALARGAAYLAATQDNHGLWTEPWFTAPGFPRVFYLKYHGYSAYFPVWALARYARLTGARGFSPAQSDPAVAEEQAWV
jgi:squalene-hopene/tetraprenyl-beta-curcumene cyclase